MNILIPHYWLLEHLETKVVPKKLQEYLSLCGPTVEQIRKVEGEPIYDIEVTTNRVDSMSVRGIAREAAAILPEFAVKATLAPLKLIKVSSKRDLGIKIENNPKLCKRILAIKLENVKLEPSPKWLQKRLVQVGQRPLNNAIDITNYAMWELGHPMHVFDWDRLREKTIVVREAKKGETLVTLDGKKYKLLGGEVVFDNGKGEIIDLPGIMGTKNTVVTDKTKNVLLWIESVEAVKIRQAAMGLGIRSQAAVLNEKQVDPELGEEAMLRGVELFKQLTEAKEGSKLVDIYPKRAAIKTTLVPKKLISVYLGVEMKNERIKTIWEHLGCEVKGEKVKGEERFVVTPPSWRASDLMVAEDYVEEVARIYGYHNLPSKLPVTAIPDNPSGDNFVLEAKVKQCLADWGWQEIYTYSMVSEELAGLSGYPVKSHLKIKNPLTSEWVYMRRSLIPSHLEVIEQNKSQKQVAIFEMANVYQPQKGGLPKEELQLVAVTNGDFKVLKGVLEALLERLFLKEKEWKIEPIEEGKAPFGPNQTGQVWSNRTCLGYLGRVGKTTQATYALQILVGPLIKIARTCPAYIPVRNLPPVIEDMTFTLPEKTYVGEVMKRVRAVSRLIEKVELTKVYRQNYTFRVTYRAEKKSLAYKEIKPVRKKIAAVLEKEYFASLVGKI